MRFVTTVLPCRMSSRSLGCAPTRSHASLTPVMTPTDWSSGVESTLTLVISPEAVSCIWTSVNVPPTSTPKRYPIPISVLSCGGGSHHTLLAQALELRLVDAELVEHVGGVGAQRPAGRLAYAPRRAGQPRHDA